MEMSQDVRATLDKIVHTLVQEYRPRQIILYGSHVYGAAGQASDMDLLIVKDSKKILLTGEWCGSDACCVTRSVASQ
jgi:predicted nucleotidyltransferase